MNPQVKAKPDDTRARIMEAAEALFRRLGFAKTAVADIAAELRMSPANVYRFFPSKNAIVEAICRRFLSDLEEKAWAAARSKGPAAARVERLFLEILAYHKENLLIEQRVNEIVVFAMEHMWDTIRAHKAVVPNVMQLILRDAVEAGQFEPIDPRETAELMFRSMANFCHPMLVSEGLRQGRDIEAEARASIRFLLRAITPRQ